MPNSISLLKRKKVDKAHWKGSQKNILLGLYHLKNKRGLKKFEMFGEPEVSENYTFDQIVQNTHIYFNFHNEFISAPKNLKNKMMTLLSDNKNNKKGAVRYGVVPVFLVGSQFTHAHSNIILFDFKEQTCERFEPYGFSTDDTRFDTRMRHFLKNSLLPFKMKYLKPLNDEDFQETEEHQISDSAFSVEVISSDPGGYCAAWCIWYIEMRLRYSNLTREQLVSKINLKIKKLDTSVRELIRNYSEYLIRVSDKIMEKKGLDKNKDRFSKIEYLKRFYDN